MTGRRRSRPPFGASARPSALSLLAALALAACGREPASDPVTDPLSFLAGPAAEGFARADGPRVFAFPADHGVHPAFRTEWWYVTGNLEATDGTARALGFQITVFRFALAPPGPPLAGWAARALWLGQVAVSDLATDRFLAAERVSRGLPNVAGAASDGLDVRVEDWRMVGDARLERLTIRAPGEPAGLDLVLSARREPVLQGDDGLSLKGREPGNASYYYSVPRLGVTGTVSLPEGAVPVTGTAWLDREWSTSALEDDQTGWDWFALQLDDGTDVMVYRLRTATGGEHPASAGIIVRPDGRELRFPAEAIEAAPLRYWQSPRTGRTYPVAWRLTLGPLELTVAARSDPQEHAGRFEYWEGAVRVTGQDGAGAASGVGYLEMTGYE